MPILAVDHSQVLGVADQRVLGNVSGAESYARELTSAELSTLIGLGSYLTVAAAAAAYQPVDGDLTALAGLTGTNTIYYRSGANTWTAVTIGSGLSFSGGTLATSGVLLAANNLSDLTDLNAAYTNLGLGTGAFANIGSYVPYTGATTNVNLGSNSLTLAKKIHSDASLVTSAGASGVDGPSIEFKFAGYGIGVNSNGEPVVLINNVAVTRLGSYVVVPSNGAFAFSSATDVGLNSVRDLYLLRDAIGILAQRNGTNAQQFNLYNTYTSSTSFERGILDWKTTANTFRIGTDKGSGGGSARDMSLVTDGVERLRIGSTGLVTSAKTIGQLTETANTPSGTTQTITLDNGNHQILDLSSSTGNVTVTFTVPTYSGAGSILIKQHGTTARGITWAVSAGTIVWLGTEPTWSGDGVSKYRRVSWYYSPTESKLILAASDSN